MKKSEKIEYLKNSNPAVYGLIFKDYQNGRVIYSEPTKSALELINNDLSLFQRRQKAIIKRSCISCGDWVILPNGEKSRVTVNSWEDSIQIGGSFGGSFHIYKSGVCSYSGGCGDSVKRIDLQLTDEYEPGDCWIFSQDHTGAHRGVHLPLMFKVYKIEKK